MKHLVPLRHPVSIFAVMVSLVLGLLACGSSTTMEQQWKAPGVSTAGLQKLATVYISTDVTMRRTVEDTMAQKLRSQGVQAQPAYSLLSDEEIKNHDLAKAKLRAQGFDGIVAIRLVSNTTQLNAQPVDFAGYWGGAWPDAYDADYLSTEQVVRVETSVYSLGSNKLVWSGLSKTVDPSSPESAIKDVTSTVAKSLTSEKIVRNAG